MFGRMKLMAPPPMEPLNRAWAMLAKREAILKAALSGGHTYEDARRAARSEYPDHQINQAEDEYQRLLTQHKQELREWEQTKRFHRW